MAYSEKFNELNDLYSNVGCCSFNTLADDELFISDAELESWVKDIYTNGKGTMHVPTVHKVAQHLWKAIQEGYGIDFDKVDLNSSDATMLNHLLNNCYTFSAAKNRTHLQQLTALINDNGKIREWPAYFEEAKKLNLKLNKTWLKTEYDLAIHGATMASKWIQFKADGGDPLLTYSTVQDSRVRPEHQVLDGITLPMSHPFWKTHYTPNGYKCRCDVFKAAYGAAPTPSNKIPTAIDDIPPIFRTNLAEESLVFPKNHPYYKTQKEPSETSFIPDNLDVYKAVHNNDFNTSIFEYLKKPTELINSKKDKGAYYDATNNKVHIPLNRDRVKRSTWYLPNVMNHEYGHALDFQYGLQDHKLVKDLMAKHRKLLSADANKLYKEYDARLYKLGEWAYETKRHNIDEMVGGVRDTIASLNPKFGGGHKPGYWLIKGNKEAEFLAHMSENVFGGNPVFKKVMPELYDDMLILWEQLKKEVIQK